MSKARPGFLVTLALARPTSHRSRRVAVGPALAPRLGRGSRPGRREALRLSGSSVLGRKGWCRTDSDGKSVVFLLRFRARTYAFLSSGRRKIFFLSIAVFREL